MQGDKPGVFYSPLYVKVSEYLFHASKASVFTRIAVGIIDKIDEFPHVNIEELALYAVTTPPSVTKFCKIIGYNSFAELRNNIHHYNDNNKKPPLDDERAILNLIYHHIPHEQCKAMARVIAGKKKIVIVSNEFAFNIANMLKEMLSSLNRKVYLAHRENDDLIAWLLKEADCILVLTFTGKWMDSQPWCARLGEETPVLLISSQIPTLLSTRSVRYVSMSGYPYLMASNYHSHKYLESIAWVLGKNVIEFT